MFVQLEKLSKKPRGMGELQLGQEHSALEDPVHARCRVIACSGGESYE